MSLGSVTLQRIFAVHALDRIGADLEKISAGARREVIEVKPAQPLGLSRAGSGCFRTDLACPIPHLVNLDRRGVQPRVGVPLHLQAQRARHRRAGCILLTGQRDRIASLSCFQRTGRVRLIHRIASVGGEGVIPARWGASVKPENRAIGRG